MWEWLERWITKHHRVARLWPSTLGRRDAPITNAREAIGWWEARRIPFNLIVGSTGIFSCMVAAVVALASYFLFDSDFGFPDPPLFALFAVLLYGIAANVCFTGGWIAELFVRRVWPREADRFATSSFSLGLAFSVLLTLTPAVLIGVGEIFGLLARLLRIMHTH